MKTIVLLTWLLAVLTNNDLVSQSKAELKKFFYEGESWILFEDYKDALPFYQQLLKAYPDNSNFKYRIGQCYLNTPGEKDKAMTYLEDAVKNINTRYKAGRFRETGAPYDALYYLANAYRINNKLDQAVETYELFMKNMDPMVYDSSVVTLQIQSCLNAKDLMKTPLYIKENNLGKGINESTSEFNPVFSDDENLLVFSRSEAFYNAILYSVKSTNQWGSSVNMNELLKVDKDFFPTSISKDSKNLYLYSSVDYDGDIYTTRFENGIWTPVIKLNDKINTKYWESHATISHDNKKLYFTSNRKGGFGGLDIYVSEIDSTGNWGVPVNLGPVINTPYNEETPFLSKDDKKLFFSSQGHYTMGGYDIFISSLLPNGEWSVPQNIGYPLNTTDDDIFFNPLDQGYEGYLSKYSPDGYGKQDIYKVEIFSEQHPRYFFVTGTARIEDQDSNIDRNVKISALNASEPGQPVIAFSDPESGGYHLKLPQGKYDLTYEADSSERIRMSIEIPLFNNSDSFLIPLIILPKTEFVSDLTFEENKLTIEAINPPITEIPIISKKDVPAQPVIKPEDNKVIAQEPEKPAPDIISPPPVVPVKENRLWILYVVLGGGLILFLFFFFRKRQNSKK